MELKKLVSLGFEKNVGTGDRVARLVSGAALVGAGWSLGAPAAACVAMTVFGVMWMATGVLSKCSIYHALGFSTCPVGGETRTEKRPPA